MRCNKKHVSASKGGSELHPPPSMYVRNRKGFCKARDRWRVLRLEEKIDIIETRDSRNDKV